MARYTVTKRITTREEYDAANRVILEALEAIETGDTSRREEYELLSLLCRDYMNRVAPEWNTSGKAHEILAHIMEQHELRQTDLVGLLGDRSSVSSILAGRRRIPMAAAHALKARFGIDFPALIARQLAEKVPTARKRPARKVAAKNKRRSKTKA